MATKVKKRYDLTSKQKTSGDDHSSNNKNDKNVEKKDLPIGVNEPVLQAPLWRRLGAFLVDVAASLGMTYLMLTTAGQAEVPTWTRVLYIVSAVAFQLLFFGITPTEYYPGQTLGRRFFRLYVRDAATKKPLSFTKGFLRDFVYGILAGPLTIIFELGSVLFDVLGVKKANTNTTYQKFTWLNKEYALPRDEIFKDEVIFIPKKPKNIEEA